eukprot:2101463-Prymnesium_polylepis.2
MHDCHALRHTRGPNTSRATRPRTSILCPTAHTSRIGAHRTALSSRCTHAQHTCYIWRLSPADAKLQAPGGMYTPHCVQQAAVALTSRQQRR